jgi:phage tail sheath gpL-like
MASQTKITITHDKESTADLVMKFITQSVSSLAHISKLTNFMDSIKDSSSNATVALVVDDGNGVAATGTIAFSGTSTANDTVLINGVTFTAVNSGATGNQWNKGASATASADNLATAINASATALVSGHVTASASSGTLTITSKVANVYGNAVTIAEGVDGGSVMTVSGARLTGGTAPTNSSSSSYSYGL